MFVTDRDLALMNSLSAVFPDSAHLLCQWHIRKNVVARAKVHFRDRSYTTDGAEAATSLRDPGEAASDFVKEWDSVTYATSESDYRSKWGRLKSQYASDAALLTYL